MDVLAQILDSVAMRGSLYFTTEFTTPWGLTVPADTNVCRFHVVTQGYCWVTVEPDGPTALVSSGDLILVPHGSAHRLQDALDTPAADLGQALVEVGFSGDETFRWGQGGSACRMACGYFDFDQHEIHPLLAALPPLLHLRATASYEFGWIENVMRHLVQEANAARAGSGAISRRLAEVLFIQALRHYAETTAEAVPVLSAIVDRHIGRSLRAIHSEPEKRWTLEALAREAALSRTAFAQRFSALVGMTAMRYLTRERLRLARRLLRSESSLAVVAERVGYQSEAAFSRKFKSEFGVGPGAYRRAHS